MGFRKCVWAGGFLGSIVLAGCTGSDILAPELMSVGPASAGQCPNGGTLVQNYIDSNNNGKLDPGEQVLSSTTICNGANGQSGAQGNGAGISVSAAPSATCPAGGDIITTFIDANNNGIQDPGEPTTSISAICNGINGTNGTDGTDGTNGASAYINVTAASAQQCPNGGAVYSSGTQGQTPVQTVICDGTNGQNGTNGTNAVFEMGSVGPAVPNEPYTACHHDYIYIPGTATARGWLIFRHQYNGSEDQGIGSTGFEVWDVDIANFYLESEVGDVIYCQLNWDTTARVLSYTVLDNSDGLAGLTGSIQL